LTGLLRRQRSGAHKPEAPAKGRPNTSLKRQRRGRPPFAGASGLCVSFAGASGLCALLACRRNTVNLSRTGGRAMSRILALCCASLLLVPAVQAAPAPDGEASPTTSVPIPLGVADLAGKTGFVANDKGGIDVINLENGELLWDTKDANKPLAVVGKKLIAQAPVMGKANQVRVLAVDVTEKGKKVLESDPRAFRDWVSVGLTHGRSFQSSGRVHKGDLLLKWEAHAFYAGGARPTEEIIRAAKKDATGVARIDLEKGKVEMLAPDKVPAQETVKLPKELEKVTSQQYWTGSDWKTALFVNGKVASALAVEQQGDKQRMSLKRWD